MDPKREEIVRRDFPASRRGYDRDAVDAHLREIAESLEIWTRRTDSSRAEAAGAKVTEIVELAERKAAEIEEEARTEAGRIVENAEREARQQVERAQGAVTKLIKQADQLRSTVGSLGREISEELHGEPEQEFEPPPEVVPEPTVPQPEVDPSPVTVPEPAPPREPEPEPPLIPEPEPPSPEAEAGDGSVSTKPPSPEAEAGDGSVSTEELIAQLKAGESNGADESAARLVAMNMALDGSSRDEVEKHLAEEFDLGDPKKLLDEVYARVGR